MPFRQFNDFFYKKAIKIELCLVSTPTATLPGLQTPTKASSHVARTMALMTAKFAVSLAMVIALGIEKGHAFNSETGKCAIGWP